MIAFFSHAERAVSIHSKTWSSLTADCSTSIYPMLILASTIIYLTQLRKANIIPVESVLVVATTKWRKTCALAQHVQLRTGSVSSGVYWT